MARWILTEPHYLNSPDVFWEQSETDRETGRQRRKQYPVPIHLDPKQPSDWNYKSGDSHVSQGGSAFTEGCIVVCWKGKGERKDYVFFGDPTPGMDPLDDEAKEISAGFNWSDPMKDFALLMDPTTKAVCDLAESIRTMQAQTHELIAKMANPGHERR